MDDPIQVTGVDFDDEMVSIAWFDKKDVSSDGTVVQTTYMSIDSVRDDESMAYALNEIMESTSALLAYWKDRHRG